MGTHVWEINDYVLNIAILRLMTLFLLYEISDDTWKPWKDGTTIRQYSAFFLQIKYIELRMEHIPSIEYLHHRAIM